MGPMKTNIKKKILSMGAEIVHLKGYNNTGVQEVLDAAGVPRGSFYFYFKNKEEFGLGIIDYHMNNFHIIVTELTRDERDSPMSRLKRIFDWTFTSLEKNDFKGGCPIGNLTLEMADINETFRVKLQHAINDIKNIITYHLKQARELKEIPGFPDIQELTDFIFSSWEGTLLSMKAAKDTSPKKAFYKMIFESILNRQN